MQKKSITSRPSSSLPIIMHSVNVTMLSRVLKTGVVAPPLCSVNAPLGISSVFHWWNFGITTHVLMSKLLSSKFSSRFNWWSQHVAESLPYFDKRNLATLATPEQLRWLIKLCRRVREATRCSDQWDSTAETSSGRASRAADYGTSVWVAAAGDGVEWTKWGCTT